MLICLQNCCCTENQKREFYFSQRILYTHTLTMRQCYVYNHTVRVSEEFRIQENLFKIWDYFSVELSYFCAFFWFIMFTVITTTSITYYDVFIRHFFRNTILKILLFFENTSIQNPRTDVFVLIYQTLNR